MGLERERDGERKKRIGIWGWGFGAERDGYGDEEWVMQRKRRRK